MSLTIKTRLIKPWAHQVFLEGETSPRYIDCTMESCKICYKIEIAKLMFLLHRLIKEKTADDLPAE